MEKLSQLFDVCIVCALPEEARAFLEIVQQHSEDVIEERISPRYQYDYRLTTIKNDKDESLNLHISWLPRYGPQEMALHLSHVLEECQPRIAIMTGICAGDAQQVQLGDLVVADRTFTYDNGKVTLNKHGRSVHLHDTLTYQLDANILQFLGLFDDWNPLVSRLKRPPSSSKQRKRRKVVCHIKAMASGSAVRADNPFEDVRAPVRGTVAIDMEGAAFGLVMSRHPMIRWLVVKGICDYADQNKNDAYHAYAARASSLYALSFIRAYVTNERLPPLGGPSSSSREETVGVWNVPHLRNPHFTGREELLDQLHQQLAPIGQDDITDTCRSALIQIRAIKGLGGIGKTQIAVEYAYRSRDLDLYSHILWINAASEETLITSFTALAELLPSFSTKHEIDQRRLVEAIKHWLEKCKQRWLLIFDNADNVSLVREYLPQLGKGSILLTTRADAVGSLAISVIVEKMGFMEGVQLLLCRSQRFKHPSDDEVNEAGNIAIALDHLPLALDQAGAYIEETGCSLVDYLQIYQTHRKELLARRGLQQTNYPDAVATTWSLSFQKVEQASPAAAELLRLCAFLAPDTIPEELIRGGAKYWSLPLQQATGDLFIFNHMIEALLKFSLVARLSETQMFSIHRLVQVVQVDMIEPTMQIHLAKHVVLAVNDIYPHNTQDVDTWPRCLRYLEQVQACDTLIRKYALVLIEAGDLLNRTGLYLVDHTSYTIAESLYQQARTIYEQLLGLEHPSTAASLNNLAVLYESQGKFAQAELLYVRSLAIYTKVYGMEHSAVATSLNNLAQLYRSQGKFAQAEQLHMRALAIREHLLGSQHPETISSVNNLAILCRDQGKYEQVEPLFVCVLTIREQQLGEWHPHTVNSLNNLGHLYLLQKKYAQAEPLLVRALAIREQMLGTEHPNTAQSLNNLAALFRAQNKYEQAEPLYNRALAIREQVLGTEHSDTAQSLNNLAVFYTRLQKYEQAEPLYRRTISIWEKLLGIEHPHTQMACKNYASLLKEMGRDAEAMVLETNQVLPF